MSGERKDEHVVLAQLQHSEAQRNDFDDVRFVHHALAGIAPSTVQLNTSFAGIDWPVPLYINAMTGGSAKTAEINGNLAAAAARVGVPIASGSMSVALRQPETRPSFRVLRENNPDGFIMANLSADASVADARVAIDLLAADALQLHLNAVQETVMPEGRRTFDAWSENIARVVDAVDVPLVVKEVGFGLSEETVGTLIELGVRIADVSGRGGTNFARIENERRGAKDYAYLDGFGQSTPACLIESVGKDIDLLASGGVRNPLDVMKALALGARAVGASGTFLDAVLTGGTAALTELLERWLGHLRDLMALVGAQDVEGLNHTDLLIGGELAQYAKLRGLAASPYARRSSNSRHVRVSKEA